MPIHETKDGGYQWGNSGKIYTGKNAKKKAIKQAIAVAYSEAEREGKEKPSQEAVAATIKGNHMNKKSAADLLNICLIKLAASSVADASYDEGGELDKTRAGTGSAGEVGWSKRRKPRNATTAKTPPAGQATTPGSVSTPGLGIPDPLSPTSIALAAAAAGIPIITSAMSGSGLTPNKSGTPSVRIPASAAYGSTNPQAAATPDAPKPPTGSGLWTNAANGFNDRMLGGLALSQNDDEYSKQVRGNEGTPLFRLRMDEARKVINTRVAHMLRDNPKMDYAVALEIAQREYMKDREADMAEFMVDLAERGDNAGVREVRSRATGVQAHTGLSDKSVLPRPLSVQGKQVRTVGELRKALEKVIVVDPRTQEQRYMTPKELGWRMTRMINGGKLEDYMDDKAIRRELFGAVPERRQSGGPGNTPPPEIIAERNRMLNGQGRVQAPKYKEEIPFEKYGLRDIIKHPVDTTKGIVTDTHDILADWIAEKFGKYLI